MLVLVHLLYWQTTRNLGHNLKVLEAILGTIQINVAGLVAVVSRHNASRLHLQRHCGVAWYRRITQLVDGCLCQYT